MATCSVAELIDSACANGFFQLAHADQKQADGVKLQLLKEIAGDESTIGQLIQASCDNGFMCLAQSDARHARGVTLQLLCDIAEG